jgi:hypothetical protein
MNALERVSFVGFGGVVIAFAFAARMVQARLAPKWLERFIFPQVRH